MIVITTPTGQVGQQVLEILSRGKQSLRVIVRDPARLPARLIERVEVVQGSHEDPGIVGTAFEGADTVFWLLPPNFGAEDVDAYYLEFARPACQAIKSCGVKRVVGVSTLGRGWDKPAGPLTSAMEMDALIESTGVSYRSLAMPFFMENLLQQVEAIRNQGMFFLANIVDRPLATVATRDIAAAAAQFLLDDSWSGQAEVPVVSEELTPEGMAVTMSEVLGSQIRCQQTDMDSYKATLLGYGASESFAQGLVDMAIAQNEGIYDARPGAPAAIERTSFRQWCEEVLKPVHDAAAG